MVSPRLTGASEYPSRQQAPQAPQESSVRTGSHRAQAGHWGENCRPGLPGWKVCRQRPEVDQAQVRQVSAMGAIPKPNGWTGSTTPRACASARSRSSSREGGAANPRPSAWSTASESSRSWNPGGATTAGHPRKRDRPCMAAVSRASRKAAASRTDSFASGHQRAAVATASRAQWARSPALSWIRSAWRCCRAGRPASRGFAGIRPGWPGTRRASACRAP